MELLAQDFPPLIFFGGNMGKFRFAKLKNAGIQQLIIIKLVTFSLELSAHIFDFKNKMSGR
jgi:hypothetical protein